MLTTLNQIALDSNSNDIRLVAKLIALLRPAKPERADEATANVRTLTQLLRGNPIHTIALRQYLLNVVSTRHQTSLFTDTGILSNNGFFGELFQRLTFRLLPPAVDETYLRDCLDEILPTKTDYIWINAVASDDWLALWDVLANTSDTQVGDHALLVERKTLNQVLEAIQILSYRISAMGLEPELIRNEPDLETFESPFLVQNAEIRRYLDGYVHSADEKPIPTEDGKHVIVILAQCDAVIAKVRKNALRKGTSVAITYLLVRLTQNINRLRKLLELVDVSHDTLEPATATRRSTALALGRELIGAHHRKYAVRELFSSNIDLLARNVTENSSRTGEHYIAENRPEYNAMFRSAAGAGFIIGFMALLKLLTSYLRAAPLIEAFLFSMNYSIGFMLIHVFHFTVATKQPAMTAARIAAGLQSRDGRNVDLESLVELIPKVIRTQVIAVFGNILVALPTAYLIAWSYFFLFGEHLVTPEKAGHLLHDIDPFNSLALFYAAIAGVCLFLAGLISGYYDNKTVYSHIPERIARLRWLQRAIGERHVKKLAAYIEVNLGGLMGNFFFGILLGSMGTIGFLLGLPIDIRHVTFATANFATSLVGLEHQMNWQVAATAIVGILTIGSVNLLVSFSLALFVALRARQTHFRQWPALLRALLNRLFSGPRDFIVPPKEIKQATTEKSTD